VSHGSLQRQKEENFTISGLAEFSDSARFDRQGILYHGSLLAPESVGCFSMIFVWLGMLLSHNNVCEQLPANILAGMMNFSLKTPIEIVEEEKKNLSARDLLRS